MVNRNFEARFVRWAILVIVPLCFAVEAPTFAQTSETSGRASDILTGNTFLAECGAVSPAVMPAAKFRAGAQGTYNMGQCWGYLSGFLHGYIMAPTADICIPDGVTNSQLMDALIMFLRDQPARRHQPIWDLTAAAMRRSFSCADQ